MQEGTLPELGELKEPPQFANYKRSRKYEQALRDAGIDVDRLDREGGGVVVDDGLPHADGGVWDAADLLV